MKRYAVVGTGGRGYHSYIAAIEKDFSDCAQVVAIMDVNTKRMEYVKSVMKTDVPTYTDFDKMVAETKPDCVIVTTVDQFHDQYITRALDLGLHVITEKPMAINAEKIASILDAEIRNDHKINVIFNVRFMPFIAQLKRLMRSGVVGDVLNVDFEWMLDRSHGASYFRRWHRMMENSSGLMVHKATHHFDMINFLIEQDPVSVYADGKLCFYGKDRRPHAKHCRECEAFRTCEFAYQGYGNEETEKMYMEAATEDGYSPDMCPFDGEINIYDNMNLTVKYNKGATMTYSLVAYAPYEGWRLAITGTNGRLEATSALVNGKHQCKVFDTLGNVSTIDVPEGHGGHGGGDTKILDMLLRGGIEDTLDQVSGSKDGAMSCMIGICANESIKSGNVVKVADLLDVEKYFGK